MAAVRAARFNLDLTYALLYTQRHNPLNTQYAQTIAPPQDQRHSLGIGGDVTPFPHWRFTGRYSFHTGRPVSTVSLLSAQWQSVQIECLNCERIGPTHSIDLRAEWRHAFRTYKLSVYVEVLNVGNIRSPYLPTFSVVDGQVERTWFRHLPMRPFAGERFGVLTPIQGVFRPPRHQHAGQDHVEGIIHLRAHLKAGRWTDIEHATLENRAWNQRLVAVPTKAHRAHH